MINTPLNKTQTHTDLAVYTLRYRFCLTTVQRPAGQVKCILSTFCVR